MSELRSVVARRSAPEPDHAVRDKRPADGSEMLTSRTGGAYIPPARLKMMQAAIRDKNSAQFQRIAWESLKKSINGLINKVNVSNMAIIVRELFKENLVRGRGLLCKSILVAQSASPTFTHVYAAVVAVINSKFPQIGELILKRLIIQFRKCYKRNDKHACLTSSRFIAHLVNQQVAHEVLALEILTLLLENTTNDSIEVAVGFLKEAGMKLTELSPRGVLAIFERLRTILHEGNLDRRVMYMIEVMFAIRKDAFKDHPALVSELDLIEESEQNTHLLTLDDPTDPEDKLNVFRFDPDFETNEDKYKLIKKEILDADSDDDDEDEVDEESGSGGEDEEATGPTQIIDSTETNLTELRRTIYLTIQSSLDFEECCHKLLKHEFKGNQITELCHMVIDCCAQQRTYVKFYGLLAQRFCNLNEEYVQPFSDIFKSCYDTIHRFETNKLRNVAKLFAHLFFTDAISWELLEHIKLNEVDTTSSSRVFIKILFQELAEYMGLVKLNERIKDATLQQAFAGLFPRDNPRNTRFSINFFTSIGLGGLTDDLRTHLQTMPKPSIVPALITAAQAHPSSSSSDSSDSESDSSSSSSSSSSSRSVSRHKKKKLDTADKKEGKRQSPERTRHSERGHEDRRRKQEDERRHRSRSRSRARDSESSRRRDSRRDREKDDSHKRRDGDRDEHRPTDRHRDDKERHGERVRDSDRSHRGRHQRSHS